MRAIHGLFPLRLNKTKALFFRQVDELVEIAEAHLTELLAATLAVVVGGKTDQQKAQCFCCTEQALRSTKSRLNKKLDIDQLSHRSTKGQDQVVNSYITKLVI